MKVGPLIAIAALSLVLVGCSQQSPLEAAVDTCDAPKGYARVGDEGRSLNLDTEGDEQIGGLSIDDLACVLNELDVPDSVIDKMDSTRALDGMQTATWGDITATWTYHPDNGLDVILELG